MGIAVLPLRGDVPEGDSGVIVVQPCLIQVSLQAVPRRRWCVCGIKI
jgi:hypothetical protein